MGSLNLLLKKTPHLIIQATEDFFSPQKPITETAKFIARHHYHSKVQKKSENILPLLNNLICYNQGSLIEYSLLAAERHKKIKDEYRKKLRNKSLIHSLMEELMSYLNNELFRVSLTNFDYLRQYFSGRHEEKPRICLKGNFKTQNRDTIISVFRDKSVNYVSDCDIEQNSGFYYIYKTGKYYINNNIPESIQHGYKNPRINNDQVKLYLRHHGSSVSSLIQKKNKNIPRSWAECWNNYNEDKDSSDFYKFTLVIPMTLMTANLSAEFKKKIKVETSESERIILGFLCIDHVEADYFVEEVDVPIGYIFSDLLSQYVMTRLIYTEISDTFQKVDQYLSAPDDFDIKEQWAEFLTAVNRNNTKNFPSLLDFVKDIGETDNNQLYEVDSMLLKYAQKASDLLKEIDARATE